MAILPDLPPDALLCLCHHIVAAANTGQLLRLALVCKQYLELVAHADWFWQQQSASLGWIRVGFEHPPQAACPAPACHPVPSTALEPPTATSANSLATAAAAAPQAAVPATPTATAAAGSHAAHAHGQPAPTASATASLQTAAAATSSATRLWFEYYCLRMSCRWRLRLLVRKYIPFLNIQSRLAMRAGASMQELEAVEGALGMQLPWELWELYRFRGGQAPGAGVCFAEACRCLGVQELYVTSLTVSSQPSLSPEGPVTQQQQLAAVTAQLPALSCQPAQASHAAHLTSSGRHTASTTSSVAAGADACSSAGQQTGTPWDPSLQQLPQLVLHNPISSNGGTVISPTSTSRAQTGPSGSSCQHDSTTDACLGATSLAGLQAAGTAVVGGDREVRGVVFLSNTIGSVEYAVVQDSSVYLKRGFTTRRVASNLTGFIQHLLA